MKRAVRPLFRWTLRLAVLYALFLVCFVAGSIPLAAVLPVAAASEPGLVSPAAGLLIIAAVNLAVIAALIRTSRWGGRKLAIALALAYYGAVTVLIHIETWYFLASITVGPRLLPRLFVMGLPTAFVFIPIAVWILGKRQATDGGSNHALVMPLPQWIWKLAALAVLYVALYWTAGYFIAWQNPELRAFYGKPGEPLAFLAHTVGTVRDEPALFPLQLARGLLWVVCALPIVRGSRVRAGWTALLVGLLFSAPQNVGQILANPLMPSASVRLSHMIETASSTFVFGTLVVWLLHREHHSLADLFGRS